MGQNLNRRVMAESVETGKQLEFLLARQCDERQGFQFSDPLPARDFALLIGT
jgi:EAL domain-containing protein (putative c-di-GMP-specific phosphodiesterase class I)